MQVTENKKYIHLLYFQSESYKLAIAMWIIVHINQPVISITVATLHSSQIAFAVGLNANFGRNWLGHELQIAYYDSRCVIQPVIISRRPH